MANPRPGYYKFRPTIVVNPEHCVRWILGSKKVEIVRENHRLTLFALPGHIFLISWEASCRVVRVIDFDSLGPGFRVRMSTSWICFTAVPSFKSFGCACK